MLMYVRAYSCALFVPTRAAFKDFLGFEEYNLLLMLDKYLAWQQ